MDPQLENLIEKGQGGDEVEVILKLRDGVVPPSVRIVTRFGDIATCRVRRDHVRSVWEHPGVLSTKASRLVAAEPTIPEADPMPPADDWAGEPPRGPLPGATGRGVVVGIVDWGFDFAHPHFRKADGATRCLALWDQSREGGVTPPAPYGYGAVYSADEINRALRDPQPYESLGYYPALSDPLGDGSHGTHVADIAVGNGRVPGAPVGMAPEADIIFVHLAARDTGGLANLGDTARILEALDFVVKTAGERPWVANLSVGQCGGPHTGRTLVEQGMDALLIQAPGRAIVQSAGNYFSARTHATGRLHPGARHTLTWITDRADRTPNELEIWYPGRDTFTIEVQAAEGQDAVRVPLGERRTLVLEGRECGRIYHRAHDPSNGDHHVDIFLEPSAPAGAWHVVIIGQDVVDGRFDAWVERDSSCATCQSRFDPADAVPSGTTGTICNGFQTIAVGAYNPHDPAWPLAPFSSAGPTRDGREKPNLIAPGVRILAARSAPWGANADAPKLTQKSGTSMAAPHVAGAIACMFQVSKQPLWIHETRRLLLGSARGLNAPPGLAERVGSGYLEPAQAIAQAGEQASSPRQYVIPPRPPLEDSMREVISPAEPEENTEAALQWTDANGPCGSPPAAGETAEAAPEAMLGLAEGALAQAAGGRFLSSREHVARVILGGDGAAFRLRQALAGGGLAEMFDALARGGRPPTAALTYEDVFEVAASPGRRLAADLLEGDMMLRRPAGMRALTHASFLASGELATPREAAERGWRLESRAPGRYALVVEAGAFPHERQHRFARRITDERGVLPADQMILRLRPGAPLVLKEEEERIGLVVVPADRWPPDGYNVFRIRADLESSYRSAHNKVKALGGVLTSSGGLRDLSATVTPGRSNTSVHYLARAIDLYTRSGMQSERDPYLVVRDGGPDEHPLWRVYCVSESPRTDDPLYEGGLIQEGELDCLIWQRGTGYRSVRRVARHFSLTDIFERHGWRRIPARTDWRENYLSVEWWHFQNETGLVQDGTTFGDELRKVWPAAAVARSGLALDAVWHSGAFRRSPAAPTAAPAPSPRGPEPAERVRWAQAVLNATARVDASTGLLMDGLFGPRTREALRRFQAREGLQATGVLDDSTEIALVQRGLEEVAATSIFPRTGVRDEHTVEAIRRFRLDHRLTPTDDLDPAFRAAMTGTLLRRHPHLSTLIPRRASGLPAVAPLSEVLDVAAPPTAAEQLGEGSPFVALALDHCWERCERLRREAGRPDNPALQSAASILRETGVRVDGNPYFGIDRNELEAVIRAGYHSHQMPEVLLALWAKEGSTRSVTSFRPVPQATSATNARTIFRSEVYYEDLGADHFMVTTRPAPGADNQWDSSDGAAPTHEAHFADAVRGLVRAGLLREDVTAPINGELLTRQDAAGRFAVKPATKFYILSLLLVDARFTQLQRNTFPEVSTISPALNYLQWNIGASSFREFLRSAARHAQEPAHRVDGQAITIEQWALHTRPRPSEWRTPRINAIRFLHYLESYRPVFAPSMNLIKPGIEDLRPPSVAARMAGASTPVGQVRVALASDPSGLLAQAPKDAGAAPAGAPAPPVPPAPFGTTLGVDLSDHQASKGAAGTQANAATAFQTAATLASSFGAQAAALRLAETADKTHATQTADQKLATVQRAVDKKLISAEDAQQQASKILEGLHQQPASRPDPAAVLSQPIFAAASSIKAATPEYQLEANLDGGGGGGGGGGGAAASVVDPFPRPIVMSLDMAHVAFGNCIEAASRPADVNGLCGAVVDLTGNPDLPPYVGHNDTHMLYVGSLAKIYPLLAAFELRRRVTQQAKDMIKLGLSTAAAGWQDKVFAELKKGWQPLLDAAFAGLPSGFPDLAQIVRLSPDGTAELLDQFLDWIRAALGQNDTAAAGKYIRVLSYPYINGVLRAAGFFKPADKTGLWISGDYNGNDWLPSDRAGQPLTPRWQLPGHPVSNFTGTAQQVVRFLGLMAQGNLIDSAASAEMISLLGVPFLDATLREATPSPRPFTSANGKVGIGTWDGRFHDSAIVRIERVGDPARTISYAVAVLGSPNGVTALRKLELAYHDCVVARHP